jgi:hypothetical protein
MRSLLDVAAELPSKWRAAFWGAICLGVLTIGRVAILLPVKLRSDGPRAALAAALAIPLAAAAGALAGMLWAASRPLRAFPLGVFASWWAAVLVYLGWFLVPLALTDTHYRDIRLLWVALIGSVLLAALLAHSAGDLDDGPVTNPPHDAQVILNDLIHLDIQELDRQRESDPAAVVALQSVVAGTPDRHTVDHWRRIIGRLGRDVSPGPARTIAARRAQRALREVTRAWRDA